MYCKSIYYASYSAFEYRNASVLTRTNFDKFCLLCEIRKRKLFRLLSHIAMAKIVKLAIK